MSLLTLVVFKCYGVGTSIKDFPLYFIVVYPELKAVYHCNMARYISVFLLILSYVYQSSALHRPPALLINAKSVVFIPRGGGIQGKGKRTAKVIEETSSNDDTDETALSESGVSGEEDTPSNVREAIYREEVEEIKESQRLIQKQRVRREMDKSFLDKTITAFIEFFENLFSWEVIDV